MGKYNVSEWLKWLTTSVLKVNLICLSKAYLIVLANWYRHAEVKSWYRYSTIVSILTILK